ADGLARDRSDDGIEREVEAVARLVVAQRLAAIAAAELDVRVPVPLVAEHGAVRADRKARHVRVRVDARIDLIAPVLADDKAGPGRARLRRDARHDRVVD